MTKIVKPIRALLNRVQGRFRRNRSGSVLILVVALLVLLALLGTAYISTTRIDRQGAVQHTANVQIDLLVESVIVDVEATLRRDLYGGPNYRPGDSSFGQPTGYDHYDAVGFTTPVDTRKRGNDGSVEGRNSMPDDGWLAERVPSLLDPSAPFNSISNPPVWRSVSYPLTRSSATPGFLADAVRWQFDMPDVNGSYPNFRFDLRLPYSPPMANGLPTDPISQQFTAKPWFRPTRIEFPAGSGKFHPGFQPYLYNPGAAPPVLVPIAPFLAADADGDGVADAGLVKMPVGVINGVTYYYAVRVVDNNSAVNFNTAWSNMEFNGSGISTTVATPPYPGRYYTPASIGLAEMFRSTKLTGTQASAVNKGDEFYALLDNWTQWFGTRALPVEGVYGSLGNPINDNGATIPGFQYQSLQEGLYLTLGSRMSNPGFVAGPAPNTVKPKPFSLTDSVALDYHLTLVNPDATPSPLETLFVTLPNTDSIYRATDNFGKKVNSYPLTDTDITIWYGRNFNYDAETVGNQNLWLNRRALLVSNNPVSWQAPVLPLSDAALASGVQQYVASGAVTITKTSINHATHAELWRAFWNVMAEPVGFPTVNPPFPGAGPTGYQGSPFDQRMMFATRAAPTAARIPATDFKIDPPTFNNPYLGSMFEPYAEPVGAGPYGYDPYQDATAANRFDPSVPMSTAPAPTDHHPARMFRSSMRAVPDPDPTLLGPPTPGFYDGTPRLNAHQQLLLRSALAAVNAQDLRDSDDDVTAQRILLQPTRGPVGGGTAAQVADTIVYGSERQPFITEVYVDTDTEYVGVPAAPLPPNPYGYVAIELYNPYDEDIVLTNWKLAAIDRRTPAVAGGTGPVPPYNNRAAATTHGGVTSPVHNLPLDNTTILADFDPDYDVDIAAAPDVYRPGGASVPWAVGNTTPLVVPAKGYLLLENYHDPGWYATAGPPPVAPSVAGHRPFASGLPETGPIIGANSGSDRSTAGHPNFAASLRGGLPRLNVACIPGLSGVIDPAWTTPEWPAGVRSVLNRELVILRPRRADGQYSTGLYPPIRLASGATIPALAYNEVPNVTGTVTPPGAGEVSYSHLRDLVPVDSFDFTGLQLPQPLAVGPPIPPEPLGRAAIPAVLANTATAWHYARQNVDPATPVADLMPSNWMMVYPGRYWASLAVPGSTPPTTIQPTDVPAALAGDPRPRQQGTQINGWGNGAGASWPIAPPVPCTLGATAGAQTDNSNPTATFPVSFKVPLAYVNYSEELAVGLATTGLGRNTVGSDPLYVAPGASNRYPFGGFAREGDILQTPFIGAYSIRYQGANGSSYTVAEINSVSMDSAFAEDTDVQDDPVTSGAPAARDEGTTGGFGAKEREQLGRFAPIRTVTTGSTALDIPDYKSTAPGYPEIRFTSYATPNEIAVNDYGYDPSYQPAVTNPSPPNFLQRGANWEPFWRYRWATDLFEYLTVRTPADDYLPNVPAQNDWVEGRQYRRGEFVSYFNSAAAVMAHQIWMCNVAAGAQSAAVGATPVGNPDFVLVFNCPAVKNVTDPDNAAKVGAIRGTTDDVVHGEDNAPVEGLININTAGWRVLATLPMIVNPSTGLPDDQTAPSTGLTYRQMNEQLAKTIVYYRDIDAHEDPNIVQPHGPFRSIFELNRVVDLRPNKPALTATSFGYPAGTLPGFQNGYFLHPFTSAPGSIDPDDSRGDLTPVNPTAVLVPDGVRSDYEERFGELTRISNLITTRSDSFTVYVLLQGWRSAETKDAELVVQRRIGYIIDRSRLTQKTPDKMTKQAFSNN